MAPFRKRGPYQWPAQVRKKGHPLQIKNFETHAEAEQWARAIEGVTPLKKAAEPETNRLDLMMRHHLARRFVAGVRGVHIARWRDECLRRVTP